MNTGKKNKETNELLPELQVIYEDNHLLVVFKPHRLLIQSDQTSSPTLFKQACQWLKDKYKKPGNVYLGMINRLDRPVSGLVVFGKTSKASSRLSEQIRQKEVKKNYLAIVEGNLNPKKGSCTHYLTDPGNLKSLVFNEEKPGTKKAELKYEEEARQKENSLVKIELITGRRHQIRAQLSHLGCPIRGDGRYGAEHFFKEGSIALIAYELRFTHPTTGEGLVFQVPDSLNSVKQFWNGI
jgi:23S rRNA pseudouridine1911/1915/1917 synthase